MASGLTEEQLDELADRLQGTCQTLGEAMGFLDDDGVDVEAIDHSDLQADLADRVELCDGCGWWFEPCELACAHDVYPYCKQCRLGGKCDDCVAEERGE